MSRWAGVFLVLGAMAGCTLFGHRAASAPDNSSASAMSTAEQDPAVAQMSSSPTMASTMGPGWSPPIVTPTNAGPAAAPPSIEPGRTNLAMAPSALPAPPPSTDDLTAPLPPPHYMTNSLRSTTPDASGMPALSASPTPSRTLPDVTPAIPAPTAVPANPFRPTPPLPKPITSQAPMTLPAPENVSTTQPTLQLTAGSGDNKPTTDVSSSPQARLVGGIDAAPSHVPALNASPLEPTVVQKAPPTESRTTVQTAGHSEPAIENAPTTAGGVRLINSKRFSLAYAVKDLGPSGLAGVELWYTQDGKTWQKHPSPMHHHSPYVIEVGEEDLYGFTLVAHSGAGISTPTPKTGDLPQVWVEVDVTSPIVRLLGAEPGVGADAGTVIILWSATDKHLGAQPITISYAERPDGPWTPVAQKIQNTGRYVWQITPGMPMRFYVRVEAVDEAGNVGQAQTSQPVMADIARPSIAILGVAPAARR